MDRILTRVDLFKFMMSQVKRKSKARFAMKGLTFLLSLKANMNPSGKVNDLRSLLALLLRLQDLYEEEKSTGPLKDSVQLKLWNLIHSTLSKVLMELLKLEKDSKVLTSLTTLTIPSSEPTRDLTSSSC